MKTTILERAQKIIDQRRYTAENTAINNKVKAYEDPIFKERYQKYTQRMIEESRLGQDESEATKALKALCEKRLVELGIGSIEPQFYCKKCGDLGIKNGRYCSCIKAEINNILRKESGFDKLCDFCEVDFKVFDNPEFMEKLYDKMKKWCHSKFEKNLIFISGDTGVGKTYLIKCMANELINNDHVVNLVSSFSMHQDFVKSFASRDLDEKSLLLDKYLSCEILFIDDLGTEMRLPNVTLNYLYQVINERKMKRLPTVITSNLDLYDIKDYYDERISSRIIDTASSICVCIKGKDLRLKK